ncbi:unnamed protein product [Trichobilharzia regenti]|nr:unnamed protein product [Trichobilharzia regenti]
MSTKRSVYKKNSPNNKIVVYLVQRDIFDDLQSVDPIEGVVTIDKNSLKNAKVFARIRCTFRYGEQQLDEVLSGVTFYKEFFIQTIQIYPMENNLSNVFSDVQVSSALYFLFLTFCLTILFDVQYSMMKLLLLSDYYSMRLVLVQLPTTI